MSYYDKSCWGERKTVTVDIGSGVKMTLRCEGRTDHYKPSTIGKNEVPGYPHHSTIKLNEAVVEFEWTEDDQHAN
jgi:hypothetical protein